MELSEALLGYTAAANTGSTDEESLVRSICHDANAAEVGLPPAGSNIVGVADPIAVYRTLPANLTRASHIHLALSIADPGLGHKQIRCRGKLTGLVTR